MRRKSLIILILACLLGCGVSAAKKRTSKDVRRERQRTEQQIKSTQADIRKNQEQTRRELNRLSSIEAKINLNGDTLRILQASLDSVDRALVIVNDSIALLDSTARKLKANHARTLREVRARRQGMSDLAFIFSSESFGQAWRRIGYLRQLAKAGSARAREINQTTARLEAAREHINVLRETRKQKLSAVARTKDTLEGQKRSANDLVSSLKKRGGALDRELKRRRDEANALERELNKVIEREMREAEERRRREEAEAERRRQEEARAKAEAEAKARAEAEAAAKNASAKPAPAPAPTEKPAEKPAAKPEAKPAPKPAATKPAFQSEAAADRALSGSFAANKGRLLFPVSGRYSIVSNFGTNTHPGLSKVRIDNLGIDVEVPPGTSARSVFEGVVSSIFRLEGYNNVVIVRHGEYLTVYGGLDTLRVKKGDKVKTGQTLGTIFVDQDDDSRARLHFEIRQEKKKLNPVEWVR